MTPELRKLITERYSSWTDTWGMSFAFSVTQSVEKSEEIVVQAVAALISSDATESSSTDVLRNYDGKLANPKAGQLQRSKLPASVNAARYAAVLWELSEKEAYRGFGSEPFFRMPAMTRAVVVLKAKAQLSRLQIAEALKIKPTQVDDHLENARLLYSDGRSWLVPSVPSSLTKHDASAQDPTVPNCPKWKNQAFSMQDIFAQYIGNDLNAETNQQLHSHLVTCNVCRNSFANFKKNYVNWTSTIPEVDPDPIRQKHLKKMTRVAFRVQRHQGPNPWAGVRRVLRDGQVRAVFFGLASLWILHLILNRNHLN